MAIPKAVNTFVFIIRDAVEKQIGDLVIPDRGKTKPHQGQIFSVGSKVTDQDIKKGVGKKAVFHKTVGQDCEIDGVTYLVLMEHEIIGVL